MRLPDPNMPRSNKPRLEAAPPARAAALQALEATLDRRLDVQAALDEVLRNRNLIPADAALASELTYGSLRLGLRIDYLLSKFLRKPEKSPLLFRRILRLAAYELLYLDRAPAYASVHWAVEAVKRNAGKGLAGAANAVLRRMAELAEAGVDPEIYREDGCGEVLYLSRFYACPEWIVALWLKDYGPETARRLLAEQAAPPALGVAVIPGRPETDDLAARLASHPGLLARQGLGFALPAGPAPEFLASADPAAWRRQSFAARQALLSLDPAAWTGPVWDACAGQGGKTRLLLEAGAGPVLATDVHRGRLARLRDYLADSGANAMAAAASALQPPPLQRAPGAVLLDVPCSGLGVLSRRPDIKWKRRPEDLRRLSNVQSDMLENGLNALKPGGVLAYLTCTVCRRENESAVEKTLKRRRDVRETMRFSTSPEASLGERFFASLLQRV
ncbi:MAG: rRNA (cytosine967-C5)-methyltransferase [Desulfovibrionales bacterium]|nr:rRNA (cytosine967-C5)-methyltransferase [Desulfovibrionales bacterium]